MGLVHWVAEHAVDIWGTGEQGISNPSIQALHVSGGNSRNRCTGNRSEHKRAVRDVDEADPPRLSARTLAADRDVIDGSQTLKFGLNKSALRIRSYSC